MPHELAQRLTAQPRLHQVPVPKQHRVAHHTEEGSADNDTREVERRSDVAARAESCSNDPDQSDERRCEIPARVEALNRPPRGGFSWRPAVAAGVASRRLGLCLVHVGHGRTHECRTGAQRHRNAGHVTHGIRLEHEAGDSPDCGDHPVQRAQQPAVAKSDFPPARGHPQVRQPPCGPLAHHRRHIHRCALSHRRATSR